MRDFNFSKTWRRPLMGVTLTLFIFSLAGCEGCRREIREEYYESLEKVGLEKREMLVKRVDKARDAQEDAQEQFTDALEQFQALVGTQGTELEATYKALKAEFEDSEARAEQVHNRIKKVENVAEALFAEWKTEIDEIGNQDYKRRSQKKLTTTKARYDRLLSSMNKASESMDPVLAKLRDQVLYLKHNLNAQALGSLDREAEILETDIGRLIEDMQASIREADQFIAEMAE